LLQLHFFLLLSAARLSAFLREPQLLFVFPAAWLLRASAVAEISGLQLKCCKRCVAWPAISNEATVSNEACRLAPVAIGELNLSEPYVTRCRDVLVSRTPNLIDLFLGCASENRQLTGPLEAASPLPGLSLRWSLFSYTQTVDDFSVTVGVLSPQIVQQTPPLTDQLQ
jgi:hypothetical protein